MAAARQSGDRAGDKRVSFYKTIIALRSLRWSEICAMGIVASFRDLYNDIYKFTKELLKISPKSKLYIS